jgi:hypothetical protein
MYLKNLIILVTDKSLHPHLIILIANHENRILQSSHSFYFDHAEQDTVDYRERLEKYELCRYILDQPAHHKKKSFAEEYESFLKHYQETLKWGAIR